MLNRLRALVSPLRRSIRLRYLRTNFRNGDALLQSYLAGTPCDEAICTDGSVILHPPGRSGLAGMILEVWYDRVYTRSFYRPRRGDTLIDAGANIGLFSLLIARRQPACRILAFEPFAENFELLNANLASAGATSVRTFPIALGGQSGAAVMVDGGGRSQDHRLVLAADISNIAQVQTCTLKEVLAMADAESIAMFKCDIEASEHDLFADADSDLLRRVERFAIEYHDHLRAGTLELLRSRLAPTHHLRVQPSPEGAYGMLYATAR